MLVAGEWETSRSGRLTPRKEPSALEEEAEWATEPFWMLRRRKGKSPACPEIFFIQLLDLSCVFKLYALH